MMVVGKVLNVTEVWRDLSSAQVARASTDLQEAVAHSATITASFLHGFTRNYPNDNLREYISICVNQGIYTIISILISIL